MCDPHYNVIQCDYNAIQCAALVKIVTYFLAQ